MKTLSRRAGLLTSAIALSAGMVDVLERVARYGPARTPVVFVGAVGTGKSHFARALHEASGRTGAFVDVTAQEFGRDLALSQLFGHIRGAFTGADRAHVGYFGQAERGTLLLDDFHLLHRSQQAMLLRVLEQGAYRPLGAERDVPLGCRVVVGLGDEPDTLVERGRMLADLRSRLGFMIVRMPPLAERSAEVPVLAALFLSRAPEDTGVPNGPSQFTPAALAILMDHQYSGNVRELRELVKEAYLHAVQDGSAQLGAEHLDPSVGRGRRYDRAMSWEEKRRLIDVALAAERGNVTRAARRVGASRNTVLAVRGRTPL